MNLQIIRDIARERGFHPGRLTKIDLIRCIQREEGNFDCYGTALTGYCDQHVCLWREDCLDLGPTDGEKAPAEATPATQKEGKKKTAAGPKDGKPEKGAKPTAKTRA